MKVVRVGEGLILDLDEREKQLLFATLQLYPLLNPDYHQLTRTAGSEQFRASQELLCEAMSEQRKSHKQRVTEFLGRAAWRAPQEYYRIEIDRGDIEWFLQVLNDVRVGSWVQLGRPDQRNTEPLLLTEENAKFYGAMQVSGYFEMAVIQTLQA